VVGDEASGQGCGPVCQIRVVKSGKSSSGD